MNFSRASCLICAGLFANAIAIDKRIISSIKEFKYQ